MMRLRATYRAGLNSFSMKYFLAQDNDCHWYLVEASHRAEWYLWVNQDFDSEDANCEVPDFAKELNRGVEYVEFENPIEMVEE